MNSRINRLLPPEVRQELALRYRLFFSFVASKARRLSRNVVKEVENFSDFCAFTYRQPRTGARIARNWFLEDVVTLKVLLIIIWVLLLNYGEISVFEKHIKRCDWSSWENWPDRAIPHHLVFVTDPQLIDPSSYPGRPWPVSSLGPFYTDQYLRRTYSRIQRELDPSTIIFLGDLFDGGREWSTNTWRNPDKRFRGYDDTQWHHEFKRFSRIFLRDWKSNGEETSMDSIENKADQESSIRVISSLPGNHDLGFGTGIDFSVRDRFVSHFGDSNRIDVIGNHTFVSIDTASLSAKEQDVEQTHGLIWQQVESFLNRAKANIADTHNRYLDHKETDKAAQARHSHFVEDTDYHVRESSSKPELRGNATDFPTVLLTHVPLFRAEGTPCGPLRERHPPTKPPSGQTEPVDPDPPNSLFSAGHGYQYQNVLSYDLTSDIIKKLGGFVDYAFSGDDHDYCEVVHRGYPSRGAGIREITVKSLSFAMGVRKPGFLLVSLWNEVDQQGRAVESGTTGETMQTKLCLMPDQLGTFFQYAWMFLLSAGLLTLRALRVVFLPKTSRGGRAEKLKSSVLPTFMPSKSYEDDASNYEANGHAGPHSSSTTLTNENGPGITNVSARNATATRPRSVNHLPSYGLGAGSSPTPPTPLVAYAQNSHGRDRKQDDSDDSDESTSWTRRHTKKKTHRRIPTKAELLALEIVWCIWHVARLVLPYYVWLGYR